MEEAVVEKERQEIRSLQEQLAALKEISEKGKENGKTHDRKVERSSKTGGKRTPQMSPGTAQEVQMAANNSTYLDNLCIFCGEKNDSFTDEGLDLHYWKHCPMLIRCVQCRQVVEISSLTDHLLMECERKNLFMQCARCSEAIHKDHLGDHAQSPTCKPLVSGRNCNHCPLCHENFSPGEESWKSHLMRRDGCSQNSRRILQSQHAQLSQGKVGGVNRSSGTTSKGRGFNKGTKIPAPSSKSLRAGTGTVMKR